MTSLILVGGYMKNTSKHNASGLVKYIATREGVEKISSSNEKVGEADKLVRYMAERPGVVKQGSHGLFSSTDEPINLSEIAKEVGEHEGNIWTTVLSLTREDAERLGYNNAEKWKMLLRANIMEISKAHNIKIENLKWYAAFHDTATHPHVHLLVYSTNPKEGFRTKAGTKNMRNHFISEIYANQRNKYFRDQTEIRNKTKELFHKKLDKAIEIKSKPIINDWELQMHLKILKEHLKSYQGKKVYGYLPKELKDEVDEILKTIMHDDDIMELYSMWNDVNREKLGLYYKTQEEDIPIEENKEFKSLKNDIIRKAMSLPDEAHHSEITKTTRQLFLDVLRLLSNSYDNKNDRLDSQVDSKLRSKIEEKKQAQGLKTDNSITNDNTQSM